MPSRTVTVGSAGGLHARPAALFVAAAAAQSVPVTIRVGDKRAVPARSILSVLSLGAKHGTEVILEADGDGANDALDALADLLAHRVTPPPRLAAPAPVADRDAELSRALAALEAVATDLSRRAAVADRRSAAAAEILRAQVLMAQDPALADAVTDAVTAGASAGHAIDDALALHRQAFQAAGGYLAERVTDLDDIRNRAVAVCLGLPMPGIPAPGHPYVLIAADLAPADTAGLDTADVLALVTEAGGPTSHTAILARALGLPAVVRCTGVLDIPDGTVVSVDGGTGQVVVGMDADVVAATRAAEERRRQRIGRSSGPGRTADGHPVALLANIGSARDLPPGDDCEGIGLFRTELLYLDRTQAPGRDEQVAAYTEVFTALPGRKVVVRTLDAGADKPLPFLGLADEPNPALGVRGLVKAGAAASSSSRCAPGSAITP